MCYNFYGGDYMAFTHLHIESNYAMNGSNIRVNELIELAKSYGFGSLAITDNKMYGSIHFYKACIANDIKPIFGLKVIVEGIYEGMDNTLLLYAKNNVGYHNLLRIASYSGLNGSISLSELKQNRTGIIGVLLSEQSALYNYYIKKQKNEINESFSLLTKNLEEFYISITEDKSYNDALGKVTQMIVVPKVSYLHKDDKEVSEILKRVFQITDESILGEKDESYFKPEADIINHYKDYQEALENTIKLADKCNVSIDFSKQHLPKYKTKNNVSSKAYLNALVYKGLSLRIKGKKVDRKLYEKRLKYELDVIDKMGYNDYFLIVWDFVKYAKNKKYLVGPGRGSAAASLVSYCLGITSVDSIAYNLVFERFLNPERITLPDIDMDLPDDKRDDIIGYVRDLYGVDRVANICTFGTFQAKSAIRDTARVLNVEGVLLSSIVKETEGYKNIKEMIKESEYINNVISQNQDAAKLLNIASEIEGLHRHVSTHAAGIIVTEDKMTNHTAVQNGLLDMMQTQYEAKNLEELGLLKIDFLGLRNLTSIDKIVRLINEKEKKKIDIYKVPLDDQKTFDLLKKVETTGVFQLESKGMRSLINQMQVDSFEDIVTILALFRPGPMENIPSYIKRRFDKEKVTYPHPILEKILSPTNGIIIYQEQIIQIASSFAGYSLGEADLLRRAVSKKQQKVLEKERINFVAKSKELGRDDKVSNEIYDYIVKFANYGFNRAHSVAYAMVSYWMAYLKANYPKYFISVLTTSVIGSESQMREYIYESNKLGVKILKPSINSSSDIFYPEGENLRYPLLGIKNLGRNTVRDLLLERENKAFSSFYDFVSRTHKFLNRRVLESLIYAGALDEFKSTKQSMIRQLEEVINFTQYGDFIKADEFVLTEYKEYDYSILEEKEKAVIGFNLFVNPLLNHEDYIKKHKLKKPSTITTKDIGREVRFVGIVYSIRKITTKNNKEMAFITISDEYNRISGVLFSSQYSKYKNDITKSSVYLLKGRVEQRNNEIQIVINNLHKLD